MIAFIKSALSGRDNVSIDIGRILLTFVVFSLNSLEAIQVIIRHAPFDAVSFSGANVGLLTGGAAALLIKKGTEP
jgi:hypothetical protein